MAVAVIAGLPAADAGADTFTVSGHIRFGGVGYAGVEVTLGCCASDTVVTDAAGAFTATGPLDSYVSIEVQDSQVAADVPRVHLLVDYADDPLEIDLGAPTPLLVQVREEDDSPVSGVNVSSHQSAQADVSSTAPIIDYDASASGRTPPSGDVTLSALAGTSDVRIFDDPPGTASARREVTLEDEPVTGSPIEVALPATVPLTGTVHYDGAPVPYSRVGVESGDGVASSWVYVDETGTFSLAAVPGPASLDATIEVNPVEAGERRFHVSATSDVSVPPGGDEVAIDLPPPVPVTLTSVDTLGGPVPFAHTGVTSDVVPPGLTMPGTVTAAGSSSFNFADAEGVAVGRAYVGPVEVDIANDIDLHGAASEEFFVPPYHWQRRVTVDDVVTAAGDDLEVTLDALPGVPTDVSFELSDRDEVTVTWEPPAPDSGLPVTGYVIYVGRYQVISRFEVEFPSVTEVGPDERSAVVGFPIGATKSVRIYAINESGPSAPVEEVMTSPFIVPGPPNDVTFTAGVGEATVAWSPPDPVGLPITGYRVIAGPPGTFFQRTFDLGAGATSVTVDDLANGRATPLLVRARTAEGFGPMVTGSATPRLVHRVDVSGRLSATGPSIGGDDYRVGATDQVLIGNVRRGPTGARHPVTIQNDGSTAERMVVRDRSNAPGLEVRWKHGAQDVTRAVRAGTYRTPVLTAGQSWNLTAVTRVRPGVPRGLVQVVTLEARPAQRLVQRDKIAYWLTVT